MKTNKTKQLLLSALNNTSPDSNKMGEVRAHIKKAINKLESVEKQKAKKNLQAHTEFQKWWGNIVDNTNTQAMSPHAAIATIKKLDDMIKDEQQKIIDLQNPEINDLESELLND